MHRDTSGYSAVWPADFRFSGDMRVVAGDEDEDKDEDEDEESPTALLSLCSLLPGGQCGAMGLPGLSAFHPLCDPEWGAGAWGKPSMWPQVEQELGHFLGAVL